MHVLLLLLLLLAVPAKAQELATIRPLVTTGEATLRLGDVFEGAGPRAALAIGASPAPGRRLVLEVPQLQALARAHGLAWRPLSAFERVVVERPGRAVSREEIDAALRAELLQLGMDPAAELDLGAILTPMVPPGVPAQLAAEGMSYDAASGRFSATLVVMAEGMAVQRLRLGGRAAATLPVVVATRRLGIGEVVGPRDIRSLRVRAERVRPGTAERPDQVIGLQLHRPLAAEAAYVLADLGPPIVIEKNALVTLVLEAPGIALTAAGRALEAAPRGGMVPVMNLASRAVVEAEVLGPDRVRVAMGATPISR